MCHFNEFRTNLGLQEAMEAGGLNMFGVEPILSKDIKDGDTEVETMGDAL